jgi:lysophospholipase L1-like esterase
VTYLGDTGNKLIYPTTPGSIDYSTKRVWPLGDSITFGVGDTVSTVSCGWRDLLQQELQITGQFSGVQFVGSIDIGNNCLACPHNNRINLNDGHSGFECNMLTSLLPTIYPVALADVVLFMIGTNDLIAVQGGTETIGAAVAAWNNCFSTLIAQNPDMLFFVATLVPSPNLLGPDMNTFNANIVSQVATAVGAGRQAFVCDQFNALNPATDFDSGGVHPNNATGYPKMAAKWYSTLTTLTP